MKFTQQQKREKILAYIQELRLLDDEFMTKFFENELECTSLLIQIILDNPTLKVLESISQYNIKNLQGRSVKLDVKATDDTGNIYNIEIQRASKGAGAKRARYHSSLLDANLLGANEEVDNLPETYVIFITEKDVLKGSLPVYHIERTIQETGQNFGDKAHIIYVNASYHSESELGILMHDFRCRNPEEMKIPILVNRAKSLKEINGGKRTMSESFKALYEELYRDEIDEKVEEIVEEKIGELLEGKIDVLLEKQTEEIVWNMLKKNMDYELISEITQTSIEKIKKIAQKMTVNA